MWRKNKKQQNETARRGKAARLLLLFCLVGGVGSLAAESGEYLLSQRRAAVVLPAAQVSRTLLPPVSEGERIDLNTADQALLRTLPGIGPALAQAIVDYRESCGGFYYIEELMDVPGIGAKRYEALRDRLTCLP